jgi:hypothetical protein
MENRITQQYNQMAKRVLAEMHIEEQMMNGVAPTVEELIEKASDDAKRAYMTRIWAMTKDQLFHEVMRVQGEAAKLLMSAQAEIDRLKALTEPEEDGDAIH